MGYYLTMRPYTGSTVTSYGLHRQKPRAVRIEMTRRLWQRIIRAIGCWCSYLDAAADVTSSQTVMVDEDVDKK